MKRGRVVRLFPNTRDYLVMEVQRQQRQLDNNKNDNIKK